MRLTEDEIYRSSTQFRLWSFTPEALATQRKNTNAAAAERVRAAVKRRASRDGASNGFLEKIEGENRAAAPAKEVECLTLKEERKIIDYYCFQCIAMGDHLKFPTNVIATGVQFMKRFYLTNSPMTYQPKEIMRSALYLATKTENYHITSRDYASRIPKTTPEQVLAPEYLITQALRFTFDIRHPHRGLNGGLIELLALAHGKGALLPGSGQTSDQLQKQMLQLPLKSNGPPGNQSPEQIAERIGTASAHASKMLKTGSLLSDAYFLYTPSQIWLAAYLLADEPLTLFYISTKFSTADGKKTATGIAKEKILATIRACAQTLEEGRMTHSALASHAKDKESANHKELVRIEKKLHGCRDPDKLDLVKLNKAQKRDAGTEMGLTESVAKRRKLERENFEKENDAFWGPELPKRIEG